MRVELAYERLDGFMLTVMADSIKADDQPRIRADLLGLGFEMSSMALFSATLD